MTQHDPTTRSSRDRWVRVAAWFLAVSYGIGAPLMAVLELRGHVLSHRFGYTPALILAVCALQLVCAIAVLVPRLAPWAAAFLTFTTMGAAFSHLRIGSPLTALPALAFTVLQVWFGLASRPRTG